MLSMFDELKEEVLYKKIRLNRFQEPLRILTGKQQPKIKLHH